MVVKVIETKPLIERATEAPTKLTKADVAAYLRATKPGGKSKEDPIDALAEKFKAADELKNTEEYRSKDKTETDPDDKFKELTGGVEVEFGPKAKRAYEEILAGLSGNLKSASPKGNAIVYKQAKVLEDLFAILRMRDEDSNGEYLKPIQGDVRDLLVTAIDSFPSSGIEPEQKDMILGILDANPETSLRNVVDLIRSQGLEKLSNPKTGFIGKLSRSYGAVGKALANHVYLKVQSLAQRPLETLGDGLESIKSQVTELKGEIFEKISVDVLKDGAKAIEKHAKTAAQKTFLADFLEKLETLFKASSEEEAKEAAYALTDFLNTAAMIGPQKEADALKYKNLEGSLSTAIRNSGKAGGTAVKISTSFISGNTKLEQSFYDDVVKQSKAILANNTANPVEIGKRNLEAILSIPAAGNTLDISRYLPAGSGLNPTLNKEQVEKIREAIGPNGNATTAVDWKTAAPAKANVDALVAEQTTTQAAFDAATTAQQAADQAKQAADQAKANLAAPADPNNLTASEQTAIANADKAILEAQAKLDEANTKLTEATAAKNTIDAAVTAAQKEATTADYVNAIRQNLTDKANAERDKQLTTAKAVKDIDQTTLSAAEKLAEVLKIQSTWILTVKDDDSKKIAESLKILATDKVKKAKEEAKSEAKFVELMANSVIKPILTKARTVNATAAKYLVDSMLDENGQFDDEFRNGFKAQAEVCRAEIESAKLKAEQELETAKLTATNAAIDAVTSSVKALSIGGTQDYNGFITLLQNWGQTQSTALEHFHTTLKEGKAFDGLIKFSTEDSELLDTSKDNSLPPFDRAKVQLGRVRLITETLLKLKETNEKKPEKLDQKLKDLLNSANTLVTSLSSKVLTDIRATKRSFDIKHANEINRLEDEVKAFPESSELTDVWDLYDREKNSSAVKKILSKLKDSVKNGLTMTMRFLGLEKVEAVADFQKRVAAIPEADEHTGFLAALKSATMEINQRMGKTTLETSPRPSSEASPTTVA